jgi:predicted GNAT superfamily acetyltransferase
MNAGEVPHVGTADLSFFQRWAELAPYFRVAEFGYSLGGFLLAMTPDSDYDSVNFQWFRDRSDDFVYVDRIVVHKDFQRTGVGRQFYEDLYTFARPIASRITCEVNVEPPNEGSMQFHLAQGFVEVGRQQTEGGAKTVALLEKKL